MFLWPWSWSSLDANIHSAGSSSLIDIGIGCLAKIYLDENIQIFAHLQTLTLAGCLAKISFFGWKYSNISSSSLIDIGSLHCMNQIFGWTYSNIHLKCSKISNIHAENLLDQPITSQLYQFFRKWTCIALRTQKWMMKKEKVELSKLRLFW